MKKIIMTVAAAGLLISCGSGKGKDADAKQLANEVCDC